MKKLLTFLLTFSMCLSLLACGNSENTPDSETRKPGNSSISNNQNSGNENTSPTIDTSKPITVTFDEATKTLTVSGYGVLSSHKCKSYADVATQIIIEEGCTSIDDKTFSDFSNVTKVSLPSTLTSIGKWGFSNCNSMVEIDLPDSIISIGDYAFKGCKSLTAMDLPKQLQTLGTLAFENCESLTQVSVYEEIRSIYGSAFKFCPLEFTVYNNVEYLGNSKNPYLVAVSGDNLDGDTCTIADTCLVIGGNAFEASKISNIVIPDSVKHICGGAFRRCNLSSVTLPKNLLTLGGECFRENRGLTMIDLPDTVTFIGTYAFKECYNLETVNLPSSLKEIENDPFMATDISEMIYNGTKAQWETITKEKSGTSAIVHCTDGDVDF